MFDPNWETNLKTPLKLYSNSFEANGPGSTDFPHQKPRISILHPTEGPHHSSGKGKAQNSSEGHVFNNGIQPCQKDVDEKRDHLLQRPRFSLRFRVFFGGIKSYPLMLGLFWKKMAAGL